MTFPMTFPYDGVQPVTLWHHQTNTTDAIPSALIRRFRHRLYSQVVDSAVPVNYAHWYFEDRIGVPRPLVGDEIHETDGTVWTIVESNCSPLTGVWQAVCETFAFAEPTETVEHVRQGVVIASLPVRTGVEAMTWESSLGASSESLWVRRLSFYVRGTMAAELATELATEWDDVLRRGDGSLWKIVKVERPRYRARWTTVTTLEVQPPS